jgi:hypothetical protein
MRNNLLIRTERKYEHWPSYDLIYEWEDILKNYGADFFYPLEFVFRGKKLVYNISKLLHYNLENIRIKNNKCFAFDMLARTKWSPFNSKKISLCIVDFFLKKENLHDFYEAYKNNPFLFISSKEVYDFLINNQPEREIYHLPLSLSDKYRIAEDTKFNKKYDLALVGRQNKILIHYLHIYEKSHNINVVYRGSIKDNYFPYYTTNGDYIGNINTRKEYLNLIRKCKVAFYSTPGIDGGEKRTNGFNQVTPKFLELIASGCNVISRYEENSDTNFFELNILVPNINNYQQFEKEMDKALNYPPDMAKYSKYLNKHYTSQRVKYLSKILRNCFE